MRRAPEFWWREPGLVACLLTPAGLAYGAIAARRLRRAGVGVGVPVICVGNPTLGGAGKTPTTIAIVRMLQAAGRRPSVLTRGYGGRLPGPVAVDPARHSAMDVGDEPLLLVRAAPTIVARDRVAGAKAAKAAGAEIIVMDDGFQNPSLAKDLSLLVIDGRRGVGNGRVFPAGPLRAPLAAQLEHANAILVIGNGDGAATALQSAPAGLPVWRARIEPHAQSVAALRGRRLLAFAGIADPGKFFATLEAAGLEVARRVSFPDHHRFSESEARALVAEAEHAKLQLVTTEKDMVRLDRAGAQGTLGARSALLPIELTFEDPAAVLAVVNGASAAA